MGKDYLDHYADRKKAEAWLHKFTSFEADMIYKIWYTPLYVYIKAPCVFLDRMNISNFGTPSNWRFLKIPSIERKDSSQITLDRGTKWAHSRWSCSEPRYCNRNLEHVLFPEIDNWTLPKKFLIDWWIHQHIWLIHIQMWNCQTLQKIMNNSDSCRWNKSQTRFFCHVQKRHFPKKVPLNRLVDSCRASSGWQQHVSWSRRGDGRNRKKRFRIW